MDKSLIESYKQEMLRMYTNRTNTAIPVIENMQEVPAPQENNSNTQTAVDNETATGKLQGIATSIRGLYFVPNTKVTVFTGTPQNMQVIDTSVTDQNGKTKEFILPTPAKAESLAPQNQVIPYGLYNMMFEADGYITNIHLNVPVFPSVTSRQTSNLLLLETAGVNKGPRIFDELQSYNL